MLDQSVELVVIQWSLGPSVSAPEVQSLSKAESFCNAVLAAFSTAWFPGYLVSISKSKETHVEKHETNQSQNGYGSK